MRVDKRFLLAIETDITRNHDNHPTRPRLLEQTASEQMLAHIAADLTALLPAARQCKLAACGALFDQTQVLRPGYPAFAILERLLTRSLESSPSGQLSIGAENGRMAVSELDPEPQIPLGLLQLSPLVINGSAATMKALGDAMEHRFIEEGQVSVHTANWLESAFAIDIGHARFMTLTDLNAMYRMQLEHFGFLSLWRLIDAALNGLDEPFEVCLDSGQVFSWRHGAVHTAYQTFDYWSSSGAGKQMGGQRDKLAGEYAGWTRVMRQFLTMLKAHCVPLEFHLPLQPEQRLSGSYFIEKSDRPVGPCYAEVTEHSFAELGTLCLTVIMDGQQENYYPLGPEGLNAIQKAIRERGLGGRTIAFPGTLLIDEETRVLSPEPVPGRLRH